MSNKDNHTDEDLKNSNCVVELFTWHFDLKGFDRNPKKYNSKRVLVLFVEEQSLE